ncbi:MAG: peptide deformylase [Rhodospirillaceae bacterium]|nr:peptide deformylase [Rhodospirillaceae bacterium]
MGIRPIIKMGNPILRMNAEVVRPEDVHSLTSIIPDMITTMREAKGVGLAAPQIGISLRVIIFEIPSSRATSVKGDQPCGIQVLINPKIDPLTSEKELGWEGCLSIPELRGEVPRYKRINYTGLDAEGRPVKSYATGFHARVVQHEVDHLNGILYPERMIDLARLGYIDEFAGAQETQTLKNDITRDGNDNG